MSLSIEDIESDLDSLESEDEDVVFSNPSAINDDNHEASKSSSTRSSKKFDALRALREKHQSYFDWTTEDRKTLLLESAAFKQLIFCTFKWLM